MKKILHINACARGNSSRTLQVSEVFLKHFKNKYPDCKTDELNLFKETLSPLTVKSLSGKYILLGGEALKGELQEEWKDIERHIERFLSAEAYLLSTPMWNFSIPYPLKHYIDIIIQPKYLFRYTDKGPEGLVKNKKMVIITSRGGDYSPDSPFHSYDYQEPYLRTVFGFVGISDISFINAQPMDALGPEVQQEKIKEAQSMAERIASAF